jgi:hypothetical protein
VAAAESDVGYESLCDRYLEALRRVGPTTVPEAPPGHSVRFCANCGMRALFRLDPEGVWSECTHCGRYA